MFTSAGLVFFLLSFLSVHQEMVNVVNLVLSGSVEIWNQPF